MSLRPHNLVYDVSDFLANRIKEDLTLQQLVDQTVNGRPFVIEYIDDDDDHVIIWSRTLYITETCIHLQDARLFESENQTVIVNIPLDKLIALRLDTRRYNWDISKMRFIEE